MKGKARLRVQDRNGMQTHDTYYNKPPPKDGSYCEKCHAIYRNKHWYFNKKELAKLKKASQETVSCPACQKKADHFASGIVTLEGNFLQDHQEEILNLVKNEEKRAKGLNPLERIIEIAKVEDGFQITTTHEKLAQRIGKRLHSSFRGEVAYQWAPQDKMARVSWSRE